MRKILLVFICTLGVFSCAHYEEATDGYSIRFTLNDQRSASIKHNKITIIAAYTDQAVEDVTKQMTSKRICNTSQNRQQFSIPDSEMRILKTNRDEPLSKTLYFKQEPMRVFLCRDPRSLKRNWSFSYFFDQQFVTVDISDNQLTTR